MSKTVVGVVFGGRSAEHEVSLRSAAAVIDHMDKARFEIVPIAISPEGDWRVGATFDELVADGALQPGSGTQASLLASPARRHLIRLDKAHWGERATPDLDVIFPVLHGPQGEDGAIQGLFELTSLPYVGCGVLGGSAGMDKDVMKRLFRDAGLPMGQFQVVLRSRVEADPEAVMDEAIAALGLPIFVKPANMGSSVGVSKAEDRPSLAAALLEACRYDRKLILEETINGREVELSVLGNDQVQVSLPGEIVAGDTFYSFVDKYENDTADLRVPAELPPETTAELQRQAALAFHAIAGAGLARADFFVEQPSGRVLINELNTMPGFTSISMYPKLWEATGLPFTSLLTQLIELALEIHGDRARNATARAR